jgi:hypothetical protein
MKKDADKSRGKMVAQKRKDEKVASQEEIKAAVAEASTRPRPKNGTGKQMELASGTFAKAADISGAAE